MRRLQLATLVFATAIIITTGAAPAFADAGYTLKIDAGSAPMQKGKRSVVKVVITPGSGYHMNKDYPTALNLTPPAGVTVEKPKLTAKDAAKFEEAGATFVQAFPPACVPLVRGRVAASMEPYVTAPAA